MKLTALILGLSIIPHLFAADTPEIEDGNSIIMNKTK
jgi:hypothetical protein